MNDNRLRNFIILGFIGAAILIVGIFALFQNNGDNQAQPDQTEWTDSASGDTVQDTQDKTPEKYGVDPNQPVYLGFVELLDRGMLLEEVDNAKVFLTDFVNKEIKEGKPKITRLSVETDSVTHTIQSNKESFTMNLVTNKEQRYSFDVTTDANTNIRTLSLTKDGTVVYSTKQNM